MDDDEEYMPYEEEESEEDAEAAARDAQPDLADDDDDDEAFLRGQTDGESDSGWDTGADTDAAFSGDDTDAAASGAEAEEEELFPEGSDAMALLAGMEGQQPVIDTEPLQPYEVLARQKRARRKQVTSQCVCHQSLTAVTRRHCLECIVRCHLQYRQTMHKDSRMVHQPGKMFLGPVLMISGEAAVVMQPV